ncbi:MAG: hypothetical protein D6702_06920 [Planctomycetota bacterium]|nr:MAG: hypothetical protein D6702_06920 [Planctomycetota bacterium]
MEATATFDEQVRYDLGKVYERKDRAVNPDDGSDSRISHPITVDNFYPCPSVDGLAQTYDANGQLTDNGPWAFSWTVLGQLAQAEPDAGTTRQNRYDAFGRRVTTTAVSQVSRYLYHAWHMIGEYGGAAGHYPKMLVGRDAPFPIRPEFTEGAK